MSRTTTREIVRVCADIARLDRKGKVEVFNFLHEELRKQQEMDDQKKRVETC
jgi:hypothetical protein